LSYEERAFARQLGLDVTTYASGKQELYPSMSPIVSAAYHARGGEAPDLPGFGAQGSRGRADIRLAMDGKGELFIMSKSDGMIREVFGATDR